MKCVYCNKEKYYPSAFPISYYAKCWNCYMLDEREYAKYRLITTTYLVSLLSYFFGALSFYIVIKVVGGF